MKIGYLLAALLLAVSCNQKQSVRQHQAEDVANRVDSIYQDVANVYNRSNESSEMSEVNAADFDGKYCSEEWNATLNKALQCWPDSEELGLFEYDYWISGQDYGNVSISDVQVTRLEGDSATVTFKLHNLDDVNELRLQMVYERDNWYIDDIFDKYAFDSIHGLKDYMQTYITEHQPK